MSVKDFNRETKADREARKERAAQITAGTRGPDGLTVNERMLLTHLRTQGYEIRRSFMVNDSGFWHHDRAVVRRAR